MPAGQQKRPGLFSRLKASNSSFWSMILPEKIDIASLNLSEGLRDGIGCAVPVLIGEAIGYPVLAWAAVAAFYACITDPGGLVRTRFEAMAALGLFGSLSCASALWASEQLPWLVIPLGFIWSFACTYVRVYGEAAQKVGMYVIVTFAVASGSFNASPVAPHLAAVVYIGGILWAIALTLGIWPIHPHGPSRGALSSVYQKLSVYASEMIRLQGGSVFDTTTWDTTTRNQRREIREAIDAARVSIASVGRLHVGKSRRMDQMLTLLHCADQLFAAVIALGDFAETRVGERANKGPASPDWAIEVLPTLLVDLSRALLVPDKPLDPRTERTLQTCFDVVAAAERVHAGSDGAPLSTDDLRGHLVSIALGFVDSAAAAISGRPVSTEAYSRREPADSASSGLKDTILTPLLVNFSFASTSFRHALRLSVAATIALWLSQHFALIHGYWLTMTVVLILQPYLGTTWQITAKRIVFSSLGGIIAAVLSLYFNTPFGVAFIVFPLSIATMLFRPIDYGLFVMFLTPQFVLISSLADRFNSDLSLAWARAFDSILAGLLSVAASFLLWRSRGPRELANELGEALGANRTYLQRLLERSGTGDATNSVDTQRRLAGLQSNNAEAALERLLVEPGPDPVITEAAMTAVSGIRSITGSITVLAMLPASSAGKLSDSAFANALAWIIGTMTKLETAAKERRPPNPLAVLPEDSHALAATDNSGTEPVALTLRRIEHQLKLIYGALGEIAPPGLPAGYQATRSGVKLPSGKRTAPPQ